MKQYDFTRKANNLQDECLQALRSNMHMAQQIPGYDARGFKIPDRCCKYDWITNLNGMWLFIDRYGYHYGVGCMPLEEFCELVDKILSGKEEGVC